ncbi:hypothetical protein [Algivirga pacifica]|uniref:Uncharacterized protein n=1 Tax=Algivirga pacifica TaxID=1162670 RepID=A0ABP9DEW9_9BACT
MARHTTATGNDFQELKKDLEYQLKGLKFSPRTADVTLLTATGKNVPAKEIGEVLDIITTLLPDLEYDFGTGTHQYDDLCISIEWK